ncbi:MAG TPA: YtcA family lipoprotein [Acidobacteriaceae bacterium]|nr:YtcA family lipoprotein [Acidobacteriaceae bacterium]
MIRKLVSRGFSQMSLVGAALLLLCTTGCAYPPSFNILGSYFPSWLVCCAAAAVLTFLAHVLFTKTRLIGELWSLPFLYVALFSCLSCVLWIIFFE